MHESIAQAMYRGELRKFQDRVDSAHSLLEAYRKQRRLVCRRGPWLRNTRFFFSHLPQFTVLGCFTFGEKKHAESQLLGLYHPKVKDFGVWYGGRVRLTAKTCDVSVADLPVKISNHAVIRLIQRCNVTRPQDALHLLTPAFYYAVLVEPTPPAESVLLPCVDGAVIAEADRDDPDTWAFLTFVDDAKLRPEQRAELRMRLDKFHRLAGEANWRPTFHGIAGAELRINPPSLAA